MGNSVPAAELSDKIVRLIQVLFGVILAQGTLRNSDLITSPFATANIVATIGFASLYFTTVRSWIDWHLTMTKYPYDVRLGSPHRSTEMLRIWADLGFVIAYAYLLFTVEPLIGDPHADLLPHLQGYAVLFSLYLASGLLRRRHYGNAAGQVKAISIFGSLYLLLVAAYWTVTRETGVGDSLATGWLNAASLLMIFGLTYAYRSYRQQLRKRGRDPEPSAAPALASTQASAQMS
jgi:hypothetical protein